MSYDLTRCPAQGHRIFAPLERNLKQKPCPVFQGNLVVDLSQPRACWENLSGTDHPRQLFSKGSYLPEEYSPGIIAKRPNFGDNHYYKCLITLIKVSSITDALFPEAQGANAAAASVRGRACIHTATSSQPSGSDAGSPAIPPTNAPFPPPRPKYHVPFQTPYLLRLPKCDVPRPRAGESAKAGIRQTRV